MGAVSRAGDDLDDSRIVAASLDDPEAFGELFRRHAPRLHAYARRRLGPPLADDVVSETFATAFRQRARFDERGAFGAWLWGIASHVIARHRRQETRMYRAYARTGTDPAQDGVADLASDRASAAALGPALAKALAGLSAQERDAVLLLAWAEMSYAEIAATLGLPLGTVKAKIHRARKKLRTALPQEKTDE
ncbi:MULTISPECIES: RNA polymerase sigma factor [Actinomadura]|uniref:RNA polymerase sigma-70 factor, ECF subfamily n=1 Tax=Actinomadura madurae TaxID=1993 RepID=A0A1I5TB90_9ACTN|nr:sigma-70 family RNA polymerase sigma factor [Actinomadura madurae]SFP79947.1 RNA polymerase sigma-70 factor, ECF subfamily [Actinomadura madurae]SPT59791.1 RNA polymerase sigma factor sigY [Actinomadura madurae]